jgi:uncharacterized protein YfaS (alpha-2-macroglobulin family)
MFKRMFNPIYSVFSLIFGHFEWHAPPWLVFLFGLMRQHPGFTLGGVGLFLALAGGYLYYQSLPTPLQYQAQFSGPGLAPVIDGKPKPEPLSIVFDYDPEYQADSRHPLPEVSLANLALLDKPFTQGIRLQPDIPGQWRWKDDRQLEFTPKNDWPAGVSYRVGFSPELFQEGIRLKAWKGDFTTPPFTANIESVELYKAPEASATRQAVATLRFSHPVDRETLPKKLSAELVETPVAEGQFQLRRSKLKYTVKYDSLGLTAYVHTEPVEILEYPNTITLKLDEGVRAATGRAKSQALMSRSVDVPDVDHLFQVESVTAHIVQNQQGQPEQVLSLTFTDEVDQETIANHLWIDLLPKRSKPWSLSEASKAKDDGQRVDWKLVPNERDSARHYNLVFDAPEERVLYVSLTPGFSSVSGFKLSQGYNDLVISPNYPQMLQIAGDGSVLALSGEHKIGLLSRNLDRVRIKVDRVLPGQITHLVSQTQGDIRNPAFTNYGFDELNLSHHQEQFLNLVKRHPKEANYAAFDLSDYLKSSLDYGLFFVTVEGWDSASQSQIQGVEDKRLLLVTDLGLIVKDNADESHDLFVQSMRDGKPVADAEVLLLGLNGLVVMSERTDTEGHVAFPSTRGLEHGRYPAVYLVRHGNDTSFLPFERAERGLNFSRFDVGGVLNAQSDPAELNAFVFTDRGIYRPGEEIHLGAIVRQLDLKVPPAIPLEIEIRNPRGGVVLNKRLSLPELGLLELAYATDRTSETGHYEVDLYLVGSRHQRERQIGSGSFKVEEFQPDRLKIRSQFVGVKTKGWTFSNQLQAEVALHNLFGTPAQSRKVTATMNLEPARFRFAQFPGYHFYDPLVDPDKPTPPPVQRPLKETQTDADGLARFSLPIDDYVAGTYRLTLEVEGFEEGGGRSVRTSNELLLSPMNALVGVKHDGDLGYIHQGAERALELVAINNRLESIKLDKLRLRLLEQQTVSTLVRQANGTYQYQSVVKDKLLQDRDFMIAAGGHRYTLPTHRPGDFVLELYNERNQRLANIPFSVVGSTNLAGTLEKNAELKLKLNQQDYHPGELIEMNITAPYTGSGLITIESDRVHAYKWFVSETTSTMQSIRLPEDLEGNAYVNVAFVRAANSPEIYVSPLSYAVAPFNIDRSARQIEVDLEVPEIARPGKPMTIRYRASKPSRMVIFAIDEGILQVAAYHTPQPLDFFLRKRALEVGTQQLIDLILPEFEQILRRSASGGGAKSKAALDRNLNPFARKLRDPAIFWSGIVEAGPQEKHVSYRVPESFSGQVRVMAVAVSEQAMGAAETKTLVRGPFVISPSLLNVVAPGDEFDVTVGVSNLVEGSGDHAEVRLEVTPSEGLEVIGEAQALLKLAEGSEGQHRFRVRAKDHPGGASLTFSAKTGQEEGHLSASLSVRPAIPYRSDFTSGYSEKNKVTVPLKRQLYPQLALQRAAASSSPLVLVEGLQRYLEHFPHGCTEQIISQTFPLIGLSSHSGFADRIGDIHPKVEALITQLRTRQVASGGFNLWVGDAQAADFISVYAMHFLTEAKEMGFSVPNDLFNNGLAFLREYSRRKDYHLEAARVQAQAIYLLTRNGEVTSNALLGLHEGLEQAHKEGWKQDLTAAYVAATYQLLMKNDQALSLIEQYHLGKGPYKFYSDFHSSLTLDAQYVYLLAKHFPDHLKALKGEDVQQLVDPVFGGHYNTLEAAYTILALSAYGQAVDETKTDNEIKIKAYQSGGSGQDLKPLSTPFPHADLGLDTTTLSLQGATPFFYLVSQNGFDRDLPRKAEIQGLEIQRDYLDAKGNVVTKLQQGMEVQVRLRIRTEGHKQVDNVAVVDLLPGGFEVIRRSLRRQSSSWQSDYVDVREDRVVFYGSFGRRVTELNYRAKVTTAGRFVVPPAYAGSMYDRRIQGHTAAGNIKVEASSSSSP